MPILHDPLQRLFGRITALAGRRCIVGLVGLPGAGKSTLAAHLVGELNRSLGPDTAVALGMDGFHLPRARLAQFPDPAAALARRGAPWTFDAQSLAERLQQLRATPAQGGATSTGMPIRWPAFEHGVGDPVADAITVAPAVRLVLLEGLYLLHQEHGWNLRGLLDESWFLDVGLEPALARLTIRHMASWGVSLSQAQARVDANDRLNAQFVLATRERADHLIGGEQAGITAGPTDPA